MAHDPLLAGNVRGSAGGGDERTKTALEPHRAPSGPVGKLGPEGVAEVADLLLARNRVQGGHRLVEIGGAEQAPPLPVGEEEERPPVGGGEEEPGVVVGAAIEDQMGAPREAKLAPGVPAPAAHDLRPGAGGVQAGLGGHHPFLPAQAIPDPGAHDPLPPAHPLQPFHVGKREGAVAPGVENHLQAEPRVVGHRVGVGRLPRPEPRAARLAGEGPVEGDPHPHQGARGGAGRGGRNPEGERPDQPGGQPEVEIALPKRLAHHADRALAEIAEAAVKELRRAAAGARGPVVALDHRHPEAAEGGVAGRPRPVDPAPHHQEVVPLADQPRPERPRACRNGKDRSAHRSPPAILSACVPPSSRR